MDDSLRGKLVDTGTFRIDRERALAKLRDFQLAEPRDFHLDLGRAAALSKPSYLRVSADDSTLVVSFDGDPLSGRSLVDPFAPLFDEESKRTERESCFAFALLAALRTEPELVTIESGDEPSRALLHITSLNRLERRDPGADEKETIVTVRWGWNAPARRIAETVPRDFGLVRARLIVDGRDLGPRPLADGAAKIKSPAGRRWFVVGLPEGVEDCGLFYPYRHEVRAGTPIRCGKKNRGGLSVFVDSREFVLDLSRSSVTGRKAIAKTAGPLLTRLNKVYWAYPAVPIRRLLALLVLNGVLAYLSARPDPAAVLTRLNWDRFGVSFIVGGVFVLVLTALLPGPTRRWNPPRRR